MAVLCSEMLAGSCGYVHQEHNTAKLTHRLVAQPMQCPCKAMHLLARSGQSILSHSCLVWYCSCPFSRCSLTQHQYDHTTSYVPDRSCCRLQGQPPVDLLIRTSGETRLSDFLLWQCATAELVFSKALWPEFSYLHLLQALVHYQRVSPPSPGC